MKGKYVIFAPEFPPLIGGIANYSISLAKILHKKEKLSFLLTNQPVKGKFSFKIISPHFRRRALKIDRFWIFKKGYSFIYTVRIKVFLLFQILKMLNRPNDKIIITTLFINLSVLIIRMCNLLTIEYIVVLHGLDLIEWKNKNKRGLKRIIDGAQFLIVNSLFTQKLLHSMYPGKTCKIIHPFLDTLKLQNIDLHPETLLRQKLNLKSSDRIIISICRLVKRKGIDISIKAVIRFMSVHPDWVYLIAGEGEEYDFLKSLVPLNFYNRIVFLGKIDEVDKYSLLQCSDVFIMPNHSLNNKDIEGFGISFIEAAFFNNVVIGGASGGAQEAISEKNGFLVDHQTDPVGFIVTILNYLVDDETMLKKMKAEGKKFVEDNFSIISGSKLVDI